jgi:hypothetical protein
MDERRHQERHTGIFPAEVREAASGAPLGLVADLSTGGMLLRAERALAVGDRLQVVVELPRGATGQTARAMEVQVRWSEADLAPGTHVVGLAFTGQTPPDGPAATALLQALRAVS